MGITEVRRDIVGERERDVTRYLGSLVLCKGLGGTRGELWGYPGLVDSR